MNNPLEKRIRALEGGRQDSRIVCVPDELAAESHWEASGRRNLYVITSSVAGPTFGPSVADAMKHIARHGRSIMDAARGPISPDRLWDAPRT